MWGVGGVQGLGFRYEFGLWAFRSTAHFHMFQALDLKVEGLGFEGVLDAPAPAWTFLRTFQGSVVKLRDAGVGFEVYGCRVWGVGCRVWGVGCRV